MDSIYCIEIELPMQFHIYIYIKFDNLKVLSKVTMQELFQIFGMKNIYCVQTAAL